MGDNLVWMDLEMTGLNPEQDTVIEIATIITDSQLGIVAEGPNLIINQPAELYEQMDDWNQEHHKKSGLWDAVLASQTSLEQAEAETLAFIKTHTVERSSPLCGNSIHQDRRFIRRYLPQIDQHLHYRMIDVSSVKELCKRWYPGQEYAKKQNLHRALDDIKESIEELKFYRQHIFVDASGDQ